MKTDVQHIVSDLIQGRSRRVRENVDAQVAAVIAVENDMRFFATTVRSLLDQDVLPGIIVVADCSGSTNHPVRSEFSVRVEGFPEGRRQPVANVDVQVVRSTGAKSFADAVNRAMQYARLGQRTESLWLLHDDSRPADRRCLASLVEAKRNTPTASLLGAKQLDWSGENLHNVGYYAGRHRLQSLVVDGESDQEQYDARNDVFAVSLAGALMPLSTLEQFGGIDPWFGSFGEAGDFSRRICLGGGRVVVVPHAKIAHRRARVEGIRSKLGQPEDEEAPQDSSMERVKAEVRYAYTDVHRFLWPVMWLLHLLVSIVSTFREMFAKRPYTAWCVFCSPWYLFSVLVHCSRARRAVSQQSGVSLSDLSVLRADRRQIRQWRRRCGDFDSQHNAVLLSPLDKMHLHRRVVKRYTGALLMSVVAFGGLVAFQWDVFRAALSGASLYSTSLVSSAATFGQLFTAATTPWAYGVGVGASSPPSPWLLVWLAASVLTLGHPAAALSLIYFAAPPLCALAFWAFAGIFTRSDYVRIAAGLLWSAAGWALGLYQDADLPMLVVMIFLPAAFAFVFRAVGMYRTEYPVHARPSIQMAACSALCFIPVMCAEPQLMFPLIVVFLIFMLTVRSHRPMLLLIPLPAALSLAPTLVYAVHYAKLGLWRQLFADVTVAELSGARPPRPLNFVQVVLESFGLDAKTVFSTNLWSVHLPALSMFAVLVVLACLALVCLVFPSALRVSRMMWITAICGILLTLVSVRVAVAPGDAGSAAGSSLPGLILVLLSLIACICIMAGNAVMGTMPHRWDGVAVVRAQEPRSEGFFSEESDGHAVVAKVGRSVLVALLLVMTGTWSLCGARIRGNDVRVTSEGLPLVVVDYLQQGDNHRVLALKAESGNKVDYTVMRTRRGDLMDVSPGQANQKLVGLSDDADAKLAQSAAHLLARFDGDAVATVARLGFGGIYVANDTHPNVRAVSQALISNVNASDGTQVLAQSERGVYYQFSDVGLAQRGVASQGRVRAESSPWRYAWCYSFATVLFLYCLVALPRVLHRNREEA
ncbi:glycosyltransferase family 2 protein [Bifidobacterium bombi]|nr:glycosyltransferase family 2 protein [Bifidobacterium bombi]